ncbi:MAG: hypothetical protein K6F22_06740 [Prevotella sp.]|nr:hypothetical protein [Prevotella sp.]
MKNFDSNRFSLALKCQFMVQFKSWIRLFGIYTLVQLMAGIFFTRVMNNNYQVWLDNNWPMDVILRTYGQQVWQSGVFGFVFFCFAMLFGACYIFKHMRDTKSRSAYLMWPVSNQEKFGVALVLNIVWMAVIPIAAFILADVLRVLLDFLTGRVIIWAMPDYFKIFVLPIVERAKAPSWTIILWVYLLFFYVHSLYVVGGSLFRKSQFLMTSISILILAYGFGLLCHMIFEWLDVKNGLDVDNNESIGYVINIVTMCLTVFHYWLSYKLFTRMQVINNKWLNV